MATHSWVLLPGEQKSMGSQIVTHVTEQPTLIFLLEHSFPRYVIEHTPGVSQSPLQCPLSERSALSPVYRSPLFLSPPVLLLL